MRLVEQAGNWARRRRSRLLSGGGWQRWVVLLIALAGLGWLSVLAAERYVEWLWFDQLGHSAVLATRWRTEGLLIVGGALVAGSVLLGNLSLVQRLVRGQPRRTPSSLDAELRAFLEQVSAGLGGEPSRPLRGAGVRRGVYLGAGVAAIVFGVRAGAAWDALLRWSNAVPFGTTEPLFGRDIGFYLFSMPWLRGVVAWLIALALLALAGTVVAYAIESPRPAGADASRFRAVRMRLAQLGPRPRLHLAALGAALLVLFGFYHQVARADLVLSTRGRAAGVGFPGFTDVYVQSPADVVMTLAAWLTAALLLVAAWRGQWRLAIRAGLGYAVVVIAAVLVPVLVQLVVVLPNDTELEREPLAQAIRLTRQAYGLDAVQAVPPPSGAPGIPSELPDLPLWGQLAMRSNLNQLQAFRPYYAFSATAVDRYPVDGRQRLVIVGARELNPDALPGRSWISTHLQFTHGYGLAIALADGVAGEGEPEWVVRDIPPRGEIAVDRPEIYFGEQTTSWVVVKTTEPEVDAPQHAVGATARGVPIGNGLRRLAFAVRFADAGLLFSQAIVADSQVVYHRQIVERLTRLAPFLQPDPQPRLVVADGRLVWLIDAYTTSSEYPLVDRRALGDTATRVNYVRGSLEAVVDADDGSVRLFITDPTDPLVQSYARLYPGLLEPLDAMPASLRSHLRYPRLLFTAQADVLARFHVDDPSSFYRGDDVWRVAEDPFDASLDAGPAYVLGRQPGDADAQLLLLQPYTPFDPTRDRQNLVALLVGRVDALGRRGLELQRYPADSLLPGPLQAQRRVEQEPAVAAQLGEWQRGGALVIRGKPLLVPFEPGPLYVQAIFVQTGIRPLMPRLERVVAVLNDRVAMGSTLPAALDQLRSGRSSLAPGRGRAGAPPS